MSGNLSLPAPPASQAFSRRLAVTCLLAACFLGNRAAHAQQLPPKVHHLHHEFLPPGVIAQEQLRRNPGMAGYYQAIELIPPEGASVAVWSHGDFHPNPPGRVQVGMQLGYVYSLKLTQLPNREGVEIFPTVEIINRIYPPAGTKTRFPVPIEFSPEDIAQALSGLFVVRVVYLEDSDAAFPRADDPQRQRSIDVSPKEDPLHVADRFGRPMAIVRLGSRVPEPHELSLAGAHVPPIQFFPPAAPAAAARDLQQAVERHGADIPRESTAERSGSAMLPGWRWLR